MNDREGYLLNRPRRVPLGFDDYAGDRQFATTLARGLELLRCFSASDVQLSNAELAARTALPRPTISRLTYTLVALGYLRPSAKYGKYQLGAALISATYPLMVSIGLRQLARPLMNALADETGGGVSLGLRDRLNIVVVETSRSRTRVGDHGGLADTGLTLPIAGSAIGRAYLGGCDVATRETIVNEIRVKTPGDWTRFELPIHRAVADVSRKGYCIVDGDLVQRVLAVGIPYRHEPRGDLMVFNCAFYQSPGSEISAAWLHRKVAPKMLDMVRQLRARQA